MGMYLNGDIDGKDVKTDEILFKEGEVVTGFYLVAKGKIVCLRKKNKRLTPIFTAQNQDIIGEDCVLSGQKHYTYSAVALEDSEVIKISRKDVMDFLSAQNEWIRNILHSIGDKIDHTSDLIAEHRIVDAKLYKEEGFSEDEETRFKKLLS